VPAGASEFPHPRARNRAPRLGVSVTFVVPAGGVRPIRLVVGQAVDWSVQSLPGLDPTDIGCVSASSSSASSVTT
jgi:hypothetical protein